LLYGIYEYQAERILCSGECNIRIDLLVIYPFWPWPRSSVWALRGRGCAPGFVDPVHTLGEADCCALARTNYRSITDAPAGGSPAG